MRNFFHSHWKVIVALVLLILVAVLTVSPTSTSAAAAPPLDERLVREALAAFRTQSDFPDHSSYQRHGYPALMMTDTACMRYPCHRTAQDRPDTPDYQGMARVVRGLAKTIVALAGAKQG